MRKLRKRNTVMFYVKMNYVGEYELYTTAIAPSAIVPNFPVNYCAVFPNLNESIWIGKSYQEGVEVCKFARKFPEKVGIKKRKEKQHDNQLNFNL